MKEPVIRPLPSEKYFRELVDRLITPERADEEAAAFVEILMTCANAEDDGSWHLASAAARYAFTKTEAFETAFRAFAGYPDISTPACEELPTHNVEREM